MPMHAAAAQPGCVCKRSNYNSRSFHFVFSLFTVWIQRYTIYVFSFLLQQTKGGKKAKLALVFAGQVREFRHISLSKNDYCLIDVLLRNNNCRCITVLLL